MDRPLCKCHGEPMVRNGMYRPTNRPKWQCATKNRERNSEWYWVGASNLQLMRKSMRNRRAKALSRMAARGGGDPYGPLPRA